MKIGFFKNNVIITLLLLMMLNGCTRSIAGSICPPPVWMDGDVVNEFYKYPEGHAMRDFFLANTNQQLDLEACRSSNWFNINE